MSIDENNPSRFVLPRIQAIEGYVPGEQRNDPEIIKLNTNENPFPPTPGVRRALAGACEEGALQKYPNPVSAALREELASRFRQQSKNVLVGNGSDDILSILFRTFLDEHSSFVIPDPTYSLYPVLSSIIGARTHLVPVQSGWGIDFQRLLDAVGALNDRGERTPFVIFANPNAPTGVYESIDSVLRFAKENRAITIVDEAYVQFGGESVMAYAGTEEFPRLIAIGTFSKSYSLAGQRIGWAVAHESIIREMDKIRDSYNVSSLGQVAALAALRDDVEHQKNLAAIVETRNSVSQELKRRGFSFPESRTNFLFARLPEAVFPGETAARKAQRYTEYLASKKILIRYFKDEPCAESVRISIGTREQMEMLLRVTDEFLESK